MRGILLDKDGDLLIQNKQMVVGDTELQEVAIILGMNQGEHKFEPVLGANLVEFLKGKHKAEDIEDRIKIQMSLDNKDYKSVKEKIQTIIR